MKTGLTVGTLMDQIDTFDEDAPVVTDIGEVIFTLVAEPSDSTPARISAITQSAEETAPISVDELRAMFAYYNTATPRSRKTDGPCRDSLVLLRPMSTTVRHIAAVDLDEGTVVLRTEPTTDTPAAP